MTSQNTQINLSGNTAFRNKGPREFCDMAVQIIREAPPCFVVGAKQLGLMASLSSL